MCNVKNKMQKKNKKKNRHRIFCCIVEKRHNIRSLESCARVALMLTSSCVCYERVKCITTIRIGTESFVASLREKAWHGKFGVVFV